MGRFLKFLLNNLVNRKRLIKFFTINRIIIWTTVKLALDLETNYTANVIGSCCWRYMLDTKNGSPYISNSAERLLFGCTSIATIR